MKYIVVTFTVHREGRYFVADCVELGTFSFGETKAEALKNIEEATQLYLDTLEDLGECEQVLREKGVKVHDRHTTGAELPRKSDGKIIDARSAVFPLPMACAS